MTMLNVVPSRFQQCLLTFTMLPAEVSSETGFFKHLFNHVFQSRNFGNTSAMRFSFFGKRSKFNVDMKNAKEN